MKNQTQEVKTTTFKNVTEESGLMKLVDVLLTYGSRKLGVNEYFALMITDSNYPRNNSPHVKGIDGYSNLALVGIERTTRTNPTEGVYISKDYSKRNSLFRGVVIIVNVPKENLHKFCIL